MWEEASEVGGGSLRLDISFFFFFFFKVDMGICLAWDAGV